LQFHFEDAHSRQENYARLSEVISPDAVYDALRHVCTPEKLAELETTCDTDDEAPIHRFVAQYTLQKRLAQPRVQGEQGDIA